ncbi:hypothetical protein HMN09_01097100 [Mycena chlorophos]|uniref:Xylanolytic transcriptional activator regulatory domain-containing protein n=1 Tax=Mycena chlorophos TaxID=658473 RepID=A0A8H6SBA4_MYCCL|nr:hypothetical protein HMN09_01097100 [Mycena chlorophos]
MPAISSGKVLVSGANGFIAVWVVRSLLESGFSVRGTVRSEEKGTHLKTLFASYGDKFEVVVVPDITAQGAFDEAVKGVDAIEHTASPFHFQADDPADLIIPAVKGTVGILESARKFGPAVKRIVVTSSVAAVMNNSTAPVTTLTEADWNDGSVKAVEEKGRDAPNALKYRASKTLAERAAWKFAEDHKSEIGWDLVCLNPPLVLGPVIHEIASPSALNTSMAMMYTAFHNTDAGGGSSGNWIDVRDLADAHTRALTTAAAGGERIIVASGAYVWQNFLDATPEEKKAKYSAGVPGSGKDVQHSVLLDTSKSVRLLGMKYRGFEETTRDAIQDWEEKEELHAQDDADEAYEPDITKELCVPTDNLKLDDRDLLLQGNTTPFRFATSAASTSPSSTSGAMPGTYIFMLQNVDPSLCDPNFPWARHLPSGLPFGRAQHDVFLDLVTKFFTSWCMRVIPALFRRDMYRYLTHPPNSATKLKTAHYSPMLHNALLALGCAYSDDPRIRSVSFRRSIVAHAKSFIEAEVVRPDVSVVNALALIGSFHSSLGEMMLGWTYFGMSVRISQALGLSTEATPWVRAGLISHADMVDRNWAYWTTFTQDVCWSLYAGRDLSAPAPPSPTHLRPNTDAGERLWFEELDDLPIEYPCPPGGKKQALQANHLSKTSTATNDLLLIASKIMSIVHQSPPSSNPAALPRDPIHFDLDSIPPSDFVSAMLGMEPIPDAPYMPGEFGGWLDLGFNVMDVDGDANFGLIADDLHLDWSGFVSNL